MPRQNRVTPFGDLIATPERGLVYANRGCLHDDAGRIRRRYNGRRWISCRLRFQGWHRSPLMAPGRFTELFCLDEATAMAAGHRPCALCRREDYNRFLELWAGLHPGDHGADAVDLRLQRERVDPVSRGQRTWRAAVDELPDGAFVAVDGAALVVRDGEWLAWTPGGYAPGPERRGGQEVDVLTPPSLVDVLRAGWDGAVPLLHPSAG